MPRRRKCAPLKTSEDCLTSESPRDTVTVSAICRSNKHTMAFSRARLGRRRSLKVRRYRKRGMLISKNSFECAKKQSMLRYSVLTQTMISQHVQ